MGEEGRRKDLLNLYNRIRGSDKDESIKEDSITLFQKGTDNEKKEIDPFFEWFPYPSYRPHQHEMLEAAYKIAKTGGILMVDAPTGSGKSSIIAALLAARGKKKIIIAVRTVSQLSTFIQELELVRKKKSIHYSYLIGKGHICPLGGISDIYRRCEGVKAFSLSLMRERADKGSLVPAKDPEIIRQIKLLDSENPMICPFYIKSKVYTETDGGGLRAVHSASLKAKGDRLVREKISPGQLKAFCAEICPYETLLYAAQKAEILIVNYHHVLNKDIREQFYATIGLNPEDIILLIDEAHNCGDIIIDIESISVNTEIIDLAIKELNSIKSRSIGAESVAQVLPNALNFISGLSRSTEQEDWIDPNIFAKNLIRGSLYHSFNEVVEDLRHISERIVEEAIQRGDFKESAIEKVSIFLFSLGLALTSLSYLSLFRRYEGDIILEVRKIDAADSLTETTKIHHSVILISGTLSPVHDYRRLFFEDIPVSELSLPNIFPRELRLILCATEITTSFKEREKRENFELIQNYILEFAKLPGNLAIYFPSYQMLEKYAGNCCELITRKECFIEPKNPAQADKALSQFLLLPGQGRSGILFAVCGGKWSEGLDYKGELLNGAMVIGLPLAPFTRIRKMVMDYYKRKFGNEGEFLSYTLPAINKAQQALGRVLRTPEDRGFLVLGERRFLDPSVRKGLPMWMQDELISCSFQDFKEYVRKWHR